MARINIGQARRALGLHTAAKLAQYNALLQEIPAECAALNFPIWKECMTQAEWEQLLVAVRTHCPAFATTCGPSVHTEEDNVYEAVDVLVTNFLSLH